MRRCRVAQSGEVVLGAAAPGSDQRIGRGNPIRATDVTTLMCPRMGHMQSFASSREFFRSRIRARADGLLGDVLLQSRSGVRWWFVICHESLDSGGRTDYCSR